MLRFGFWYLALLVKYVVLCESSANLQSGPIITGQTSDSRQCPGFIQRKSDRQNPQNQPTDCYDNLYVFGYNSFGDNTGDLRLNQNNMDGTMIDLHMNFPFYGGLYNYTIVTGNGHIAFATNRVAGVEYRLGPTGAALWPAENDPALIGPYLCKQQLRTDDGSNVWYKLLIRTDMQHADGPPVKTLLNQPSFEVNSAKSFVVSNKMGDNFLDQLMVDLQEGMVGASVFHADTALVVTWENMISASHKTDTESTATYQMVLMTDRAGTLAYVILNYDHLDFAAADVGENSKTGRCKPVFNGGNHTGLVSVDPSAEVKANPTHLDKVSGVPHIVRGRHLFRVDDVVRRGGCTNKTGGTYPMMIYPNIVNMLGEMTVDVNGMCLNDAETYVLMISERPQAECKILNSAIARCSLPKVLDWGTKEVYLQSQSRSSLTKAFVGYIYFVPPTFDPMRLEIGSLHDWFKNPIPAASMPLMWYPKNFTNPDLDLKSIEASVLGRTSEQRYAANVDVYVIGYREAVDESVKKFIPQYRILAKYATGFKNMERVGNSGQNTEDLFSNTDDTKRVQLNLGGFNHYGTSKTLPIEEIQQYRFGYLKMVAKKEKTDGEDDNQELGPGLISPLIPLHWLWRLANSNSAAGMTAADGRAVEHVSAQLCQDWFDVDGRQYNFVRDTETNASCPCVEAQARLDLGRFMPHPRCSKIFRNVYCTVNIGASNCYMSASNVYGSYSGGGSEVVTHYGQVCCYDGTGFLMHTSYQPVIKVSSATPYSPGFPSRAYEFGTAPYQGQFHVPGMSAFYHDLMPYFFCCKWAKFRCQMFYWRRPSSGCQEYRPPAVGECYEFGTAPYQGQFHVPGMSAFYHDLMPYFFCCKWAKFRCQMFYWRRPSSGCQEYRPPAVGECYEFGTAPYQGQFHVPGMSAFYHDLMPYFFCCKWAKFRCQMFYWRRPSSGCQEYRPPAVGECYEFGTAPYQGQFHVPGMSAFYHDLMPYFFCCKWAKFRCQMFYWRRPSSGCQEYRPPAVGECYEFGTAPYQGQFHVPGMSAFYHDLMPYFFCCKWAKFRCQMFYWRRPSSGCQEYRPPAVGECYEFGTAPYQGQFHVPGMSAFYHDLMPYFFCCKWAKFRCQMFYWRRPSSGCQEYRPPAVGECYEFGTAPYQGQFHVPGMSAFYHDLMPYFFCCKWAKFRCQMFYWRRPSSGCQEYRPPAVGECYEFGTAPYQGQFHVPGMSAFYHDLMPYFFCCKWAKFRCQMFYWRRPSSGCQEYRPPAVGECYEFGTAPYQGQFHVPGMSAFYHDLMPYFFCCKWAKFRCQMFYWRRPSSGCQEYRPPAVGECYEFGTAPYQGQFHVPSMSAFYHDLMPYFFCCKWAKFRCQMFYWRRPSSGCQEYRPPAVGECYEFGTAPYQGQFHVPGMSAFYHDLMPYFFCCKWAKFRCQMFYWRRPSSGCQEYRPPAVGECYEFGTAPYQGQFHVPGMSAFYHDLMPYFFCCKWAKFRCQMFYWRRPSSGCQEYRPPAVGECYEFGTAPYQGQFHVPGMSAFYHDLMPYFFCCKWAKFRCQMFYWRRPSSGCQEYRPPAVGECYEFGTAPYQGQFHVPSMSAFYHDLMPYFFCCKWAKFRCQMFYWRRPSSGCQEYRPPAVGECYEFGTAPYQGQFHVPGMSAFYHDLMPYFFCCKWAKFRCQMFYWRRPSSGCQEYRPPAVGECYEFGTAPYQGQFHVPGMSAFYHDLMPYFFCCKWAKFRCQMFYWRRPSSGCQEYRPPAVGECYEFGTAPYQGQFHVPGMSAFYHDLMPYFFCCKWAKFRCQMFYWRRPSSGCQEYRPPAVGTIMGAGHFATLENKRFTFNEPGIFTLFQVPSKFGAVDGKKEVNIQVRLEQYPDRSVDFADDDIDPADLVVPVNATVVTGIALEGEDTDRVQIVLRKDTRRQKYRTTIVVNGVLRYFDAMTLQRYRGILVYVNDVHKGQAEVFVVMEKAQIGLRIRESYAMDIDVERHYFETPGVLDVTLSVPAHYNVNPDGFYDQSGGPHPAQGSSHDGGSPKEGLDRWIPQGLLRPYTSTGVWQGNSTMATPLTDTGVLGDTLTDANHRDAH